MSEIHSIHPDFLLNDNIDNVRELVGEGKSDSQISSGCHA